MANILEKIVDQTRKDLIKRKQKISYSDFKSFGGYERERRSLKEALSDKNDISIIAEIKKASPSKGEIRSDFDPQKIAVQYAEGGASAISVLTDEPFFDGRLDYLDTVSREVDIPVMRKDFIIDFYQVEEARAYGADAILLIATILDGHQLQELHHAAEEAGLECLVECYNEKDLASVNFDEIAIIGVNNRDLKKFEVDLHHGIELLQSCPDRLVKVSESGLSNSEDLQKLYDAGLDAALIGEHFMRQDDPGEAVKQIKDGLQIEPERKTSTNAT